VTCPADDNQILPLTHGYLMACLTHMRKTPRRTYWRKDAADDSAVRQRVVIVVVPIAGWATS